MLTDEQKAQFDDEIQEIMKRPVMQHLLQGMQDDANGKFRSAKTDDDLRQAKALNDAVILFTDQVQKVRNQGTHAKTELKKKKSN